jgi:hypothetical protein
MPNLNCARSGHHRTLHRLRLADAMVLYNVFLHAYVTACTEDLRTSGLQIPCAALHPERLRRPPVAGIRGVPVRHRCSAPARRKIAARSRSAACRRATVRRRAEAQRFGAWPASAGLPIVFLSVAPAVAIVAKFGGRRRWASGSTEGLPYRLFPADYSRSVIEKIHTAMCDG